MVTEQRPFQITGEVRNTQGLPLAGVRVLAMGHSGTHARTDALGRYTLMLKVSASQQRYYLRFQESDYREAMVGV